MAKKGRQPAKPAESKSGVGSRTRKLTRAQARQKTKKETRKQPRLPGSFKLTGEVFGIFKKFWKPLGGILLVYTLLNLIFASGLIHSISSNVHDIKDNLHPTTGEHVSQFPNALNGFGTLITGANNSGATTAIQTVLLLVESLVIIWALRQLLAGERISVKQSYYHSMFPLIPFALVVLVIALQFLPLTLGTAILALLLSSTITSATAVNLVFTILFILLAAWTIYMLSSSIFALYIVTLPDMEPRRALRSAKNLVRFRRWIIIRKILFVPLFILLAMGLVIVPLILFADFMVTAAFFVLVMLAILFAHTYLYSLYRSLIA